MTRRRWRPTSLLVLVLLGTGCGDAEDSSRPTSPSIGAGPSEPVASARATPRSRSPDTLAAALRDGPRRARGPAGVAAQIVAAEDAIADPSISPSRLAVAGQVEQLAYRELGVRPQWDAKVRAAIPARLSRVVTDNVASRREFRSMHDVLSDTLPAWRIVRPAPARALRSFYREAEARFGVDWEYLAAVNLVETGMGRIRGTSTAGALGPMQFLPSTWATYGEGNINSPRDSILAAGRFLADQGFTKPGGVAGALYRYNNSTAYVRGVTLLAEVMERRPRAYLGYYHWQVYYLTTAGDVLLPEGYRAAAPIPVDEWLADHRP